MILLGYKAERQDDKGRWWQIIMPLFKTQLETIEFCIKHNITNYRIFPVYRS